MGLGKSLEIIRSENIEHEIATIGFYISLGLSNEYNELEGKNFSKILYTNYSRGYQIVQEGNEMCLYTGHSEILHDNQEHSFTPDQRSRYGLINFNSKNYLTTFKENINQISSKHKSLNAIRSCFNEQLELLKQTKLEIMKENFNMRDNIKPNIISDGFNSNQWVNSVKEITAKNYGVKKEDNKFRIFNTFNENQCIFIDCRPPTVGEFRGEDVKNSIESFFKTHPDSTLSDYLSQKIATNETFLYVRSLIYLRSSLKSYRFSRKCYNFLGLYPIIKEQLDNYNGDS